MEGCVRVGILFLVALTTVLIGQFSAQGAEVKCINKYDLVFIIDASTSVTEANYKKQLEFTKDLLRNLDIDSGAVRVGALIYSTDIEIQFHLDKFSTKNEVFAAIDRIPYIYGSTNTADALETMQTTMFTQRNGDRPGVPNTCILITDGISNINSRKTIPNAEKARQKSIHIYAVGIGLYDTSELEGIASVPASKNSFNVQNFEELQGLVLKIFSALCHEIPEVTTPAPTKSSKQRATIAPEPTCLLAKVDVVIILDASTTVTQNNFDKMLDFAKAIVDRANVDSGSVRIASLIYSTDVEIQFYLDQYSTNDAIKAAIDNIPYTDGATNSADALKVMHQRLFDARRGDRADIQNVAFMITDGISNIHRRRTIFEAERAKAKGILVYAIGIGLRDTRELKGIASKPKSDYTFNVQAFDELSGLVDTILRGSDECAQDFPPVSDAGDDIDIQLPDDTVTLNGNKSADDIKVVRYQWEIIAGDKDSAVSKGMDTAYPELSGLEAGLYTLKLTVYDQLGQMDEDNVDINVKDADQKCQCSERLFKIEQETKLTRTAIENIEHTLKELVKMKKNT